MYWLWGPMPTALAQQPGVEVEITGVSGEMLTNVQSNLSLYLQRNHPLLNETLVRRLHQKAPDEIRKALEPFGYYRSKVDASLEPRGQGWIARYSIDPGPPVRVSQLNITITGPGASDPAIEKWKNNYPFHVGSRFQDRVYDDAKQTLLQIGRERGYLDGRLETHRVTVNLEPYQAVIDITYDTGPRYAFGDVSIEQTGFDEGLIRRFLTFKTGDPYDAAKILALRRAFADSDYFDRADVFTLSEEAHDEQVPIRIVLAARKANRYLAGAGYSTDTGARARVGYENRHVNQYGHRYSLTYRVSEIDSNLLARYSVPLSHPATDSLVYSYNYLNQRTDTANLVSNAVGFDVTQQTGHWQRTTGLSFERERYRIDITNNSTLLMPHVRWQRVKAEDRINPRHGWILTVGLRGASDQVVSSTSFIQGRADGKMVEGLTENSRLLLRATTGASWTPEFRDVPASQRFFAGGDNSIRGFAYNSLGPTNSAGTVIGGRNILVGSSELEIDVTQRFGVAFFIDAGNAFDGTAIHVQRGAGAGLRFRTPVGAVRLDFAQAETVPGRPWRIHFTLGPDL